MSISHMLSDIKNDDEIFDDQFWNHHNKYKIISKYRKWLKKIHFMDVKKVYFLKIMNFMDFNQLHSFLIFIQFQWICENWKINCCEWLEIFFSFTWSECPSSQISALIFILDSQKKIEIYSKQTKFIEKEWK